MSIFGDVEFCQKTFERVSALTMAVYTSPAMKSHVLMGHSQLNKFNLFILVKSRHMQRGCKNGKD